MSPDVYKRQGKSTTLRMIAGLEEISDGELYIGDTLSNDVAPKDRDIAMVFQNLSLIHIYVHIRYNYLVNNVTIVLIVL